MKINKNKTQSRFNNQFKTIQNNKIYKANKLKL